MQMRSMRTHFSVLPRTVIGDMAQIGKRIKEIEIQPLAEPDPTFVPEEKPAPERVPDKEPVKACTSVQ